MAASPQSHISEDRFAEYITELHEFSRSHRVPFGQLDDLAGLLTGLRSSKAFASEFGSMIRSIVLREGFKASEFDLLTVVAVAWGGVPKDDLSKELPAPVKELRGVVQDLLRPGTIGTPAPVEPAARESDETPTRESDEKKDEPTASMAHGQDPPRIYPLRGFASIRRQEILAVDEERSRAQPGVFRFQGYSSAPPAIAQTRLLDISAGEIIAAGLTGVVVALLFIVGSLPIYRARISVDLPSGALVGKSQAGADAGSAAYAVVPGRLAGQVAELLLERPHPKPMFRQDALSRGMRDLSLGGNETILYADLVAETAHGVKMTRLDTPHVYEITCDSWSAQFAATFCNELLGMLIQQQSQNGPVQAAGLVRTIDEAVGPGVQVYPHWYLQSFAGLVVGCLAGVSIGFVKRTEPEPGPDAEGGGH